MQSKFKKLLLYSADNAGIGHTSIAIALLSGIRKIYPDIEILAITATGIPQKFLNNSIEVIKIPSLQPDKNNNELDIPYKPRYLQETSILDCMRLRYDIINSVMLAFAPDLLMIDHHITGLAGELLPVLIRKQKKYVNFTCAYLSRGIIAESAQIYPPFIREVRGIECIDLSQAIDRYYVFEEKNNLDDSFFHLAKIHQISDKVRFVGKIATKTIEEVLQREYIWNSMRLPEKELCLVNLGHGMIVKELFDSVLQAFMSLGLKDRYFLLILVSPYLDIKELMNFIRLKKIDESSVIINYYVDQFIDLMYHSSLVICRAGYNTITELLLTGCSAIVIPEDYGSGEQSIRAKYLPKQGIIKLAPNEVNALSMSRAFELLLKQSRRKPIFTIDKYTIARSIMLDLSDV